jgi:hypothetical protein
MNEHQDLQAELDSALAEINRLRNAAATLSKVDKAALFRIGAQIIEAE